ncbi:MAG: ABC transporter permease [Armatimonadota bacterium]
MSRARWADRSFSWATGAAVGLLSCYVVLLIASQAAHLSPTSAWHSLASPAVLGAVWLTLLSATAASVLGLLIAVPAAYVLARRQFRGKHLLDALIDVPVMLSPIALGTAILMALNTGPGQRLEEWVGPVSFAFPGIVLAQFTVVSALAVRLMKATFEGINPRHEQVARSLGCTKPQAFFRVVLPLARRGLLAAFILTWARAAGEFGATVTVAGALTGRTVTIPIAIHLSLAAVDLERAALLTLLLVCVSLAVLIGVRALGTRDLAHDLRP